VIAAKEAPAWEVVVEEEVAEEEEIPGLLPGPTFLQ